MQLRTIRIRNGDYFQNYHIYQCDNCSDEIEESWPHWPSHTERDAKIHYCWECTYIKGLITEKDYLNQTGFGWMKDAHAVVVDGKIISWVGKTAPWDRKTSDYRRTKQYRVWRTSVLKRDNHSCRHCGRKEKLQAHHIKSFAKYVKQRYQRSNGLTLCEKCHRAEHKRMKQGDKHVRCVSN